MNNGKQHFVPRFYLENFANLSPSKNEYQIFVFDKEAQKSFQNNIKFTAKDGFFYDFPSPGIGGNTKIFDEELQQLEKFIAPFHKKFQKRIFYSYERLNYPNKQLKNSYSKSLKRSQKYWSYIVAIQVLRTPEYRNLIKEVKQKAEQKNIIKDTIDKKSKEVIEEIVNAYQGVIPEETIDLIKTTITATTLKIFDSLYEDRMISMTQYKDFKEYLRPLSGILLKHKFVVGVNQTDISFYTSDNPVAKIPYFHTGYASDGIEILFPIDSKTILIFRHKKHPKNTEENCKLVVLSEDDINEYNKAQVFCSNRFIYCQDNDFKLAQEICQENPEICSGVKDRVKFVK